jgi:hypothetical protein
VKEREEIYDPAVNKGGLSWVKTKTRKKQKTRKSHSIPLRKKEKRKGKKGVHSADNPCSILAENNFFKVQTILSHGLVLLLNEPGSVILPR